MMHALGDSGVQVLSRDWMIQQMSIRRNEIQQEAKELVLAVLRARTVKLDYEAKCANTKLLGPMIRTLADRSGYLSHKYKDLDTTARTKLVLMIRATLGRSNYLAARRAKYEVVNRQQTGVLMHATLMRQRCSTVCSNRQ